ncbi:MAG: hypothetical protein ACTSVU_04875 [Promethearchaeota archaeon]
MTEDVKKTVSHVSTVLILITIIAAGLFWYAALYHDWFGFDSLMADTNSQNGNRSIPADFTNKTNLILNIDSDIGDVEIQSMNNFWSSDNLSLFTTYDAEYSYIEGNQGTSLYTFSAIPEEINNTLIYNISTKFAEGYTYFHRDASVRIYVNQTFTNVSIFTNLDVGDLNLDLSNNNIDNINIESNVGDIRLDFNNIAVYGDISAYTSVGEIRTYFNDLINNSNSTIFAFCTDTGDISLNWDQDYAFGGNLTLDLQTDVGDIDFSIDAYLNQTKTDIMMQTGEYTGDYQLNSMPDFTAISDGHYLSPGFDSSSMYLLTINAITNVGDITGEYYLTQE